MAAHVDTRRGAVPEVRPMIASTGITSGHELLSDWLLLVAAVLFVLAGIASSGRAAIKVSKAGGPFGLGFAGLALVAVALLVL